MSDRAQLAALGAATARDLATVVPDAAAVLAAVLRSRGVPAPVVVAIESSVATVVQGALVDAGVLRVEAGTATVTDHRG